MTYQFRVKLITPAFTYGATNEPEIRESSIRGLLRWWFRVLADDALRERGEGPACLKKIEERVFGSTDRASSFLLRVISRRTSEGEDDGLSPFSVNRLKNICKEVSSEDKYPLRYCVQYLRYGIPDGSIGLVGKFDLMVKFRPLASDYVRKAVLQTIGLWGHLGGLGRRSRRGLGSVGIEETGDSRGAGASLMSSIPFKREILNGLVGGFRDTAANLLREISCPKGSEQMRSSQSVLRVLIGPEMESWEDALSEIAWVLRSFRESEKDEVKISEGREEGYVIRLTRQYVSVIKDVMDTLRRPKDLKWSIFGLPHNYYSRSRKMSALITWTLGRGRGGNRRASPLLFKVVVTSSNPPTYAPLVVFHKSPYLPKEARLRIEIRKKIRRGRNEQWRSMRRYYNIPQPSMSLLDRFMTFLKSQKWEDLLS